MGCSLLALLAPTGTEVEIDELMSCHASTRSNSLSGSQADSTPTRAGVPGPIIANSNKNPVNECMNNIVILCYRANRSSTPGPIGANRQ